MPRGFGRPVLVVMGAIVGLVAAGMILNVTAPSIPADAARSPSARAELTDLIVAGPSSAPEPALPQRHGQACLPRIDRGAGWLDLCWEALQITAEEDPLKDYYALRLYGSFEGEGQGGVRWVRIRSDLTGGPADNVYSAWPVGTIEGDCQQIEVPFGIWVQQRPPEEICGRTTGEDGPPGTWSHTVTWTCTYCLIGPTTTKEIALVNVIGMPEGIVPSWDVYADAG